MSCLLHISDLHFGTEEPAAVDALVRLAHALAAQEGLAAIIVSGDITQRARRAQFRAADACFARLPAVALLLLPGNHDIPLFNLPMRLLAPRAGYRSGLARWARGGEPHGGLQGTVWGDAHWHIATIDTTRRLRHTDGAVSAAQARQSAAAMGDAAAGAVRLIVVHQPVAVPRVQEEKNLLNGRGRALPRWHAAGVDAVLSGHIHLPSVLPLHPQGDARPMWSVAAGTGVSTRVRHEIGQSVNVLRRGSGAPGDRPASLAVERWDLKGDAFAPMDRRDLPIAR